jgi:hypothetical protein
MFSQRLSIFHWRIDSSSAHPQRRKLFVGPMPAQPSPETL